MNRVMWVVGGVLLGLLVAAAPAGAAVKQGDKEISFFGAVTTLDVEGFSVTVVTAQVAGGYFVNDNSQVGGSLTQQSTETSGFSSTTRTVGAFYKFHFNPKETTVPYVGGTLGLATYEDGTSSDSATAYGGMAGIKFFLSANLSVNPEVDYIKTEIVGLDVTITIVQIGLSYYF